MLIDHPLLGPRDAREFVYLGDAGLIDRPDPDAFESREATVGAFHDWQFLRDNPAGPHRELWYHEQGDRSWLVVTRDTTTHEILDVALARDVALERRAGDGPDRGRAPAAVPAVAPSLGPDGGADGGARHASGESDAGPEGGRR